MKNKTDGLTASSRLLHMISFRVNDCPGMISNEKVAAYALGVLEAGIDEESNLSNTGLDLDVLDAYKCGRIMGRLLSFHTKQR